MLNEVLIIEKNHTNKQYWQEIWRFRELCYVLSWRDVKVRYKQTMIGAAWGIFRPLLTTLIFAFIFTRIASLNASLTEPYFLMIFTGMLPWQFFSATLSEVSSSLIDNEKLITKVYFPRLIIPLSTILTGLADFAVSFLVLIFLLFWYQIVPPLSFLLLPVFIILAIINIIGLGLLLASLNIRFRDFRYVIPFFIQFGLFITPVAFKTAAIPEAYKYLFALNPMLSVIDGFRWCILGHSLDIGTLCCSVTSGFVFLYLGVRYFRKTEQTFADSI